MTTLTSSLVRPTSLTRGITRNGRMMSLVVRYLQERGRTKHKMLFQKISICFSVHPCLSDKLRIHASSKRPCGHKLPHVICFSYVYILNSCPVTLTLFCHILLLSGHLNNNNKKSFKRFFKSIYWPHELILSIRGDEADATLWVKLTEAHTLVESAVIDGYGLLPTAGRKNTSETHTKETKD